MKKTSGEIRMFVLEFEIVRDGSCARAHASPNHPIPQKGLPERTETATLDPLYVTPFQVVQSQTV